MASPQASSCPSIEALERLAAGESLDDAVERHAQECHECGSALRRMREDNDLIREYGAPCGSSFVSSRISGDFPRIEGYEFKAEIHRGGQGVVYRAVQLSTKRVVAIKTLAPRSGLNARHHRRFEREIEVVAQLRHPNIVTLFDSGVSSAGRHYLVMEYVQGARLDEHLRSVPAMTVHATLELFDTICCAVQFAHQHGVIHRDLKPANILVDAAGSPHVLDFGLAKAVGLEFTADSYTVTRGGEFIGTLAYASPEQVRADPERVDNRTDVYSLGVILYEMLTRTLPYPVEGALSDVVRTIADVEPTRPSQHRRDIDNDLDTIVLKALCKDPQRRYQSVESLHRDILHHLAGDPIDAKRDSTWYVLRKTLRRHLLGVVVAAGFVVVLAAFAATMFVHSRKLAIERDQLRQTNRALQIGEARQALGARNYAVAEDGLWRVYLDDTIGQPQAATGLDGTAGPIDAYWGLWEFYSHQPCLRTWQAHSSAVAGAASPDGRTLATLGRDGPLSIWDLESGQLLESATLPAAPNGRCSPTFLPNGRQMVWGDLDGFIHLWNLDERRFDAEVKVHDRQIARLSVSPDGSAMIVSGLRTAASILDVPSLEDRGEISNSRGPVHSASFSAKGESIVSLDAQGIVTVHRWPDLTKGTELPPIPFFDVSYPSPQACMHPDGDELAVKFGVQVVLLDPSIERVKASHSLHVNLLDLAYDPDGRYLVVSDNNKLTLFSEGLSSERMRQYHHRQLFDFDFVPHKKLIATANRDGTAKLWESDPGAAFREIASSLHTVHCVAVNADGRLLAIAGGLPKISFRDDTEIPIRVLDLQSGEVVFSSNVHANVVACVAFNPSGSILASGGHDKMIRLWDLSSQRCQMTIPAHDREISTVAFSPDGRLLMSGGDDAVKVWDTATGELLHVYRDHGSRGRVPWVCFSPDGTLLASCGASGGRNSVFLHNISTKESIELFHNPDAGTRALCFSPDGRLLAAGSDGGRIDLWDVRTRSFVAGWPAPPHDIFTLGFHPEGRILASAGCGSDITLWDPTNPSTPYLATLQENGGMVFSVRFHPDGRRLISGGTAPVVHIWDLTHYDRHIEGNRQYQIDRLRKGGTSIVP